MNFSIFLKKKFCVLTSLMLLPSLALAIDDDKPTDPPKNGQMIMLVFDPEALEKLFGQLEEEVKKAEETGTPKKEETTDTSQPPSSAGSPPSKEPEKVDEKPSEEKSVDLSSVPFARDIYKYLIEYTIGQDEAMKSLATFIHEHLINIRLKEEAAANPADPRFKGLKLEKPNILMMGPTGTGKTSSLTLISELLQVPFAIANATEWTAQGYIGGKCQDALEKLVSNSYSMIRQEKGSTAGNAVLKKAAHGIIFIDEIDKICNKSAGELEVIDRVQQELLPIIQGTGVKLNSGDTLDTSNILFIAGGAFPGLIPSDDEPSKEGVNGKNAKKKRKPITPRELEAYGMLPELAGRLCNIVQFNHLSQENLKKIVLSSKNSFLNQYILKYKVAYKIDLKFTEEAIDYIVEAAARQKTGARALNSMIFEIMKDKTFNIEDYMGKPLEIGLESAKNALEHYVYVPEKDVNPSLEMMYM